MASPTEIGNWLDGGPQPAIGKAVRQHRSPIEGVESLAIPESDVRDVVQAVAAFNRAQASWLKESADLRAERTLAALKVFSAKLSAAAELLKPALALDIGMPVRHAEQLSLPSARLLLARLIAEAQQLRPLPAVGPVAVFLGWVDPVVNFCRRVPLALMAGTGTCVKASSKAPRTFHLLAQLWSQSLAEASIPGGLFAMVFGAGEGSESVGDTLLRHPAFRVISWIGRSESALRAQLIVDEGNLDTNKRFYFVGSGRNPALIFAGLNEAALQASIVSIADTITAPQVYGPFRPSRFFVQDGLYADFTARLKAELERRRVGDPRQSETDVGPLPPSEAERFERQMQAALSETGRLVTGGNRAATMVPPSLVRDLTNCSTLQGEELAGPWATVGSFKYQHEAIKYANVSPLGLAGYVLHPEPEKALAAGEKLEVARLLLDFSPLKPERWSEVLAAPAPAVKHSGNVADGLRAQLELLRIGATVFSTKH